MAVSFGGFSIRDYASKMRSVDVTKCWPFKNEVKVEAMDDFLPPISCRRFSWWSDEVERLKKVEEIVGIEEPKANLGDQGFESGIDEESMVKICPVCGNFSAATINAVNAHIDSCLAQASREERRQMRMSAKAKTRTPKKRSIVELFAVAPQIETVDDDCDGDGEGEEGEDEDEFDLRESEKPKRRKNKGDGEEMGRKKIKKKKKKKNKKYKGVGIFGPSSRLSSKKENIRKLKIPPDFVRLLEGSLRNKKSGKEISDPVGTKKKKSTMKLKPTKLKTTRPSKLVAKRQQGHQGEPLVSVQGILKNKNRVDSFQKFAAVAKLLDHKLSKDRHVQQSDRRVRFSGKDDILGHTKKWSSSIELPQIQNLCEEFSDVMSARSLMDQSMESDKDSPDMEETREVTGSDKDDALSIRDRRGFLSLHEKKRLDHVHGHVAPAYINPNNRSHYYVGNNSLEESVDLNQALQQYDNLHLFNPDKATASHNLSFAGTPMLLNSIPKEGFNPNVRIQTEGSVPRACTVNRSLPDPFANPVVSSAAMGSLENTTCNTLLQPSVSCLATSLDANECQPYPSEANQPLFHLSPKDLMSRICSSSEELKKQLVHKNGPFGQSKMISDPVSICRNKNIDDNFIGLPLNSQGELIQWHSSGKVGLNQLFKKQNMETDSVNNCPMYNLMGQKSTVGNSSKKAKLRGPAALPKGNIKWFPGQNFLKDSSNYIPVSSRLNFAEFHDPGRQKNPSVHQLNSEMNLMNISCHGCEEYNKQNHIGREKNKIEGNLALGFQSTTQPTMRLMGKDVTVGRSDKEGQCFEDGKIWTDKEIITEHGPTMTVSGNTIPKQYFQQKWVVHPVSGTSKESITHSVEAQSYTNLPSNLHMTAVEPRFPHAYLDCRTHLMSRNGLPLMNGNHSPNLHYFTHLPPQSFFNKPSKLPVTEPIPHNACKHMLLNSTQHKHIQGVTCSTSSAFQFPFSVQDCGEYDQPAWGPSSTSTLPQWLLNATQHKETPHSSSQSYSDSIAKYPPCTMSGTNLLPLPSPYHGPVISFPAQNSNTSHPCLLSSSASLVNPSLIPTLPRFKSSSASHTSCRNRSKFRDGPKSKFPCFKEPNHVKKAKKRPAAKADESTKPSKKPNIEMQGELTSLGWPKRRENLNGVAQYNTTPELNAYQNQTSDLGPYEMEFGEDGLKTASETNPFTLDSLARSGPIKLSAGAKHILKPSQNMDRYNSRPTYSTIPFAAVSNSGKVPDFQKNSAKIYKF